MRCVLIALGVLAGCGRLGFDARTTGDGGTDDVRPDMTTVACVPVGHDEDADGVDDACDVCPHLPGDQSDQDGDGVGDACDPQPTVNRQRIVMFEPFVNLAAWTAFSNETASGDEAVLSAIGTNRAIYQPYSPQTDFFEIGFSTTTMGAGQGLVMINLDTGSGNYFCEVYDNGGALLQFTYTLDGSQFFHPGSTALAHRLAQGNGRLQLERDATNVRCTTSWVGETIGVGGPTPALAANTLVVYAENVEARIRYLVQIRTE